MFKILGYGEDAFTLWALRNHLTEILEHFSDVTMASDCLVFYRPSFGRRGGKGRAEFGEFDAILVSSENIYLIESKWDNLSRFKNDRMIIKEEQILRHHIFSWYISHWNRKYSNNWDRFLDKHIEDFQKKFPNAKMAPSNSILAANLEFILTLLHRHCRRFSPKRSIKNVLFFFYDTNRTTPPTQIDKDFNLVKIDYGKEAMCNFIVLD